MKYKILIAEDDPIGRETLEDAFRVKGYKPETVANGLDAIEKLKSQEFDLVITDLVMPGADGMDVLKEAVSKCPVILITAHGSIDNAVDAIKLGAYDFVEKPISLPELFTRVEHALQFKCLKEDNETLRTQVINTGDFESMIGQTPIMQSVFEQIKLVAVTDTTVCILGESGTGKELVANAIHRQSRRANKPFIKINCAAISENLLESELFGHEKGAFTGALKQHRGKFELADGGTILLDEISEMSPNLQTKLLRVLQEKEFERVGGAESIKVNVRIITATNANLKEKIEKKEFREDLFYRISVFPINLPPLRNRKNDIPLLIDYFLRQFSNSMNKKIDGITPAALQTMTNYDWPGNVRQLQNIIERCCVMVPENQPIDIKFLPAEILKNNDNIEINYTNIKNNNNVVLPDATMDELEEMAIRQMLKKHNGNRAKTAKDLNIGLKTLYRKIEKYNINL